jgi:hypothetical protein
MMKKSFLGLASVLVLSLAATSAFADSRAIQADIPFDFVVGDQTLPAGTYIVKPANMTRTLLFENRAAGVSALVMAYPAESSNRWLDGGKLGFNRYADRYFLAKVARGGDIHTLPKSKLEREVKTAVRHAASLTIAARLIR